MAQKEKALATIDYICCVLLGFAIAAADQYIEKSQCDFNLSYFLTALATFASLLVATFLFRKFLQSMRWNLKLKPSNKLNQFFQIVFNCRHPVLATSCIILICWSVPIAFLYPGTLVNDTWGQLQQFITYAQNPTGSENPLSDHHPLFDTFVIGAFITPIAKTTGLWHLMFFIYVIVQAICTSLTFSCVVNYAYKKLNLEILPCFFLLSMFCILQIYPVSIQNISKDSFHSWLFVLYSLFFCELVRTNCRVIKSKKFIIAFTIIAITCCLTKKVGFYVVIFTLVFAIIFLKGNKNKKLILIPFVSSVIVMLLVMPMIMHITHTTPGEKKEMLSLPFQMSARYVKEHAEEVTDEEYKVIDQLLNIDTLADRYNPTYADPVKNETNSIGVQGYLDYGKVWITQGLKHPETYAAALNCMISGWFSWSEYSPLMDSSWHSQLDPDLIPENASERDISATTAQSYSDTIHNLYNNSILRLFHAYVFWATFIPAFIICTVFRRQARKTLVKNWLAILPSLFALIFGCWLAPVSSASVDGCRYLFPLTFTAPLLIAWCLFVYKNNQEI